MDNNESGVRSRFENDILGMNKEYKKRRVGVAEVSGSSQDKAGVVTKLMGYVLAVIAFFIPWIFTPFTYEYYEVAKNTFLLIGILVLLILWALKVTFRKKLELVKTPLDLPILLFLGSQVISTVFSIYKQTSIWGYYSRFTGGLLVSIGLVFLYYAIVNNLAKTKYIKLVLRSFLISVVLLALFTILNSFGMFSGIFENLADSHPSLEVLRTPIFSPIGSSNILVFLFIITLPLLLTQISDNVEEKVGEQILEIISACVLVLAIGISSIIVSSVYVVWIMVFVLVGTVLFLKVSKDKNVLIKFVPILLFGLFALAFSVVPNLRSTMSKNFSFAGYTVPPFDTTWSVVTGTFRAHEISGFLVGTGPDTYVYNFPRFRPAEQNYQLNWHQNYTRSTSYVLDILTNTGIIGFLAFALLFVFLILFIFKNVLKKRNEETNDLLFGLSLASLSILIVSFLTPFNAVILFLSWIVLSFLVGASLAASSKDAEKFSFSFKVSKSKGDDKNQGKVFPYVFFFFSVAVLLVGGFFVLRNFAAEVQYRKSLVATQFGAFEEANEMIVKAIDKNSKRDYYHRQLASLGILVLRDNIQNLQDEQSASVIISNNEKVINEEIQKAIQLNPVDPVNWETAATIYKQLVDLSGGKLYGAETLQAVSEAIARNPYNPDNYIILGYIYQFNEDEELQARAEEAFFRAYSLQPSYPLSIFALGNYLEFVEKYDEALALYENSIAQFYQEQSDINSLLRERIEVVRQKEAGKVDSDEQAPPTDEQITDEVQENVLPVEDVPTTVEESDIVDEQ